MAIKISTVYTTRANPASLDYPQGSFKNASGPGAGDGTPVDQQWANDIVGFLQALLASAGITPNGVVDTARASQYLTALLSRNTSGNAATATLAALATAAKNASGDGTIATMAENGLKFIRGTVNINGTKIAGAGFTCSLDVNNFYYINFSSAFVSDYSVVITKRDTGDNGLNANEAVAHDSLSQFHTVFTNDSGVKLPSAFSFIAVGK